MARVNDVATLTALGFSVEQTGGGCTALVLRLDDNGARIMVTSADGGGVDLSDGAIVGFYRNDDDEGCFCIPSTIEPTK